MLVTNKSVLILERNKYVYMLYDEKYVLNKSFQIDQCRVK